MEALDLLVTGLVGVAGAVTGAAIGAWSTLAAAGRGAEAEAERAHQEALVGYYAVVLALAD